MKMLNALERCAGGAKQDDASYELLMCEGVSILLRVLSPITPHLCQFLWNELGYGDEILRAPWPEALAEALARDEFELVLQINGKLRGNLRVPVDADSGAIEQLALASAVALKHIAGQVVKKVVVVPGRLVNIVV
jgi:leucyl-tRNA synthetase